MPADLISSNGARALQRAGKGNTVAVAEVIAKADRHAQDVLPIIGGVLQSIFGGPQSVGMADYQGPT